MRGVTCPKLNYVDPPLNIIFSGKSKGGGARGTRGPNSFNFMQFLGKVGKIVCFLGEILVPPLILKCRSVCHRTRSIGQ